MEIKEDGQSTVEFILTFALGISLILMIFNSAVNFAKGYVIHYATFMATRVYLTADSHIGTIQNVAPSLSSSILRAKEAFRIYNLGLFGVPEDNFKINHVLSVTDNSENLTVGGLTKFETQMDVLGRVAGQNKLELVSESFLGKEPTRAECATRVCTAVTGEVNCDAEMDVTLYDNGC